MSSMEVNDKGKSPIYKQKKRGDEKGNGMSKYDFDNERKILVSTEIAEDSELENGLLYTDHEEAPK